VCGLALARFFWALNYRKKTILKREEAMSMTAASAAYFKRVSGQWDTLRAGYFQEEVREAAIAHAYLRPEMVAADVGSGTGFVAAGLAPLVSRVYVLDGSAAMLDVAKSNLAGCANVEFRQTDGHILPLPDASVDVICANMYLHHCTDPLAAIREMARVLKPGGRLAITDMDAHDHAWMREEMADEWLGFDRRQVKAWLRAADLVNVLVDCTSQCCASSETIPGNSAKIDVFVAAGSKRVAGAREHVQANYGAVASSVVGPSSSCCAPSAALEAIALVNPKDLTCCTPGEVIAVNGSPAASGCCPSSAPANAMPEIAGAPGQEIFLWEAGYSRAQLAAIPAEAAQISLGCGNPTALASLRPGEVVLDIGSGGGIDAFYAASRVGPSGRVIGIDMTPTMIERARRSAADAGLSNVEFRLGQAESMPVDDDTVDVILSNCVINLCEDKGRVFEEAYRVLRAGGRLAISDMVTDGPLPMSVRGDAEHWAGCVHGALPESEYLDLVRAAGFTDVKTTRSLSGGIIDGVATYSVSVSASKGGPAGAAAGSIRPAAVASYGCSGS
jgi:ubiquinone/menaquinone biosynthesis C-methylase UbiE